MPLPIYRMANTLDLNRLAKPGIMFDDLLTNPEVGLPLHEFATQIRKQEFLAGAPDVDAFLEERTGSKRAGSFHLDGHPHTRVYICFNAASTLIIPHQDTLEILETSSYRNMLDLPISQVNQWNDQDSYLGFLPDEPETEEERDIMMALAARAINMPANHIILMSGATLHMASNTLPADRVFARALVYNTISPAL